MGKKIIFKLIICFFIFGCAPILYNDGDVVSVGSNPIKLVFRNPEKEYSQAKIIGDNKRLIGQGLFGKVYDVAGHALKVIPANDFNGDEIRVLKRAGELDVGPNYYDAWLTQKGSEIYIIIDMELLPGSPLSQYLRIEKNHKEEFLKIKKLLGNTLFFDRIFRMLNMLVENNISYIDLRYDNILYNTQSSEKLKLVDFGSSKIHANKQEAARFILKESQANFVTKYIKMFGDLPVEDKGSVAQSALENIRTLAQE